MADYVVTPTGQCLCSGLTLRIEAKSSLLVTGGKLDQNAQLNLLSSIFSIIYKLGEAESNAAAEWVHSDLRAIKKDVAEFEAILRYFKVIQGILG